MRIIRKTFFLFLLGTILLSHVHCIGTQKAGPLIIFHIDMKSDALRKEYLEKWICKASEMGYNAILWEVEDKIQWETCPECVSEGAFTKKEFKEILDYSRKMGLEAIPLLQTIGHAEYVLKNKKYFSFREDPNRYDCYCTSNEEVKSFLQKWIKEYLEVFGSIKYFHLGGDEAYVFGTCERCRGRINEVGKTGLYADYIKAVAAPLLEKGIRPGIWVDMVMREPGKINLIPSQFVMWDWNYWDGDSIPEEVDVWGTGRISRDDVSEKLKNEIPQLLDKSGNLVPFYVSDFLKDKGFDVILSSSSRCYGDAIFTGMQGVHSDNIIGAARKTAELKLLGNCVTSWAVRIFNYEIQEPWFLMAPLTIKNPGLNKDEIFERVSGKLFGVEDTKFFDAISLAGFPFTFSNKRSTGITFEKIKGIMPVPKDYLSSFIEKRSKNEWDEDVASINKALGVIPQGLAGLNAFAKEARSGYEIINEWMRGAYFQYWHAIIAKNLVECEESEGNCNRENTIRLISEMKKQYIDWAKEWATDSYAEKTAGYIYEALFNYFISKEQVRSR